MKEVFADSSAKVTDLEYRKMANAQAHQLASALVVGVGALIHEKKTGNVTAAPVAAGQGEEGWV